MQNSTSMRGGPRAQVGGHEGGYDGFSFDITAAIERAAAAHAGAGAGPGGSNAAGAGTSGGRPRRTHELLLKVYNPANLGSWPGS